MPKTVKTPLFYRKLKANKVISPKNASSATSIIFTIAILAQKNVCPAMRFGHEQHKSDS